MAPPAITRLKNAGLQSPHTQFPAICTKLDCASVRPHCEHVISVWVGPCWVIGHVSLAREIRPSLSQVAPRAKRKVRSGLPPSQSLALFVGSEAVVALFHKFIPKPA